MNIQFAAQSTFANGLKCTRVCSKVLVLVTELDYTMRGKKEQGYKVFMSVSFFFFLSKPGTSLKD